jgi:hypothetical protein
MNNFVTEATGIISIPTSGAWTFGVNSDDGFRCTIGANVFEYPPPRGPADTFATFTLAAGDYPVRLVFYECGGGSEVEFFAALGTYSSFNANFRLVGNTAGGGLAVKSLPIAGASAGSLASLIATDVKTNMLGRNASAYIRLPFTVADPAAFSSLTLRVKYDDGFVAYLNGTEVARRNTPASPTWNSAATASRANTNVLVAEDISLTTYLGLLQGGANVLAIQGLNFSASDSDFVIHAELMENKVLGLTNHYFATPTPGSFNSQGFFAFVEPQVHAGPRLVRQHQLDRHHHQRHAGHYHPLHHQRLRAEHDERTRLHSRRHSGQRHALHPRHRLSRRFRTNGRRDPFLHFPEPGAGAVHKRELGRRFLRQLYARHEHHAQCALWSDL